MTRFLFTTLVLVAMSLLAACGEDTPTFALPGDVSGDISGDADIGPTDADTEPGPDGTGTFSEATIGPEGGVVEHEGARVTVPAGALSQPTVLRITSVSGVSTPGYSRFSPLYRFEPEGTAFAVPALASIAYDGDASRAAIFWTYPARSSFERLGGAEVGGRVEAEIGHFSEGFVGDGVVYVDPPDLSCLVTRLLQGRSATSAGISGGIALFLAVEDCEGRPVTGLEAADFVLLEDGEELSSEAQAAVLPQEGVGVFVSLVIDLSSSTEPVLDDLLAGAQSFVDTLEAARLPVQVRVLAFGGAAEATERHFYSLDLDLVRDAITDLRGWQPSDVGATNLNGAVLQALVESAAAQAAYRERNLGGAFSTGYVVAFTDGRDTAGRVDVATVQDAVSSSTDTLMVVGLLGDDWRPESIAELGARDTVVASAPEQLTREFSAVASRIAGQATRTYLLGYCSPSRAGSHTVTVDLAGASTTQQTEYDFVADGFDGSCRASAFERVCVGHDCGGLGCGACDDRVAACVEQSGTTYACVDHCVLLGECDGLAVTTELGYEVLCEATSTRADCGGVCRDLTTDVENCGECDVRCANGSACESGTCDCPGTDGRDCDGACRDVAVDVANCGGCGVQCAPSATCESGTCVCPGTDGRDCDGVCRDVAVDAENCGECGTACAAGAACESGACVCPGADGRDCDGVCRDVAVDAENCGGCGTACAAGASCESGACVCPGADGRDCDGVCRDVAVDAENCGGCGVRCVGGGICESGACACPGDDGRDCEPALYELSNDGFGFGETAFFQEGFLPGDMAAACFEVPGPAALAEVHFLYGGGVVGRSHEVVIHVFLRAGDGYPELEPIFTESAEVVASNESIHDVALEGGPVIDGEFCIAIEAVDGDSFVGQDRDGTVSEGHNYIMLSDLGPWFDGALLGLEGDWIIRATAIER